MSIRRLTISLIIIYGASILSFSLLEVAHEMIHIFRNSIHHHAHSHHHTLHDHDVLINAGDSADNTNSVPAVNCYFLFYENYTIKYTFYSLKLRHFIESDNKFTSIVSVIFVPPPICFKSF